MYPSSPSASVPEIQGHCDSAFAAVRDALTRNFAEHGEHGAAVALTVDGRPVVDVWAGWANAARTRPWRHDTLVDVFSVGKAVAAVCLLRLAERGHLDLDAPVTDLWPEFGTHGKDPVTPRMILGHRAGIPGIRPTLPNEAMYDWERMTATLAAERPWWEPGAAHGYHVNTYGFLVGELVRRVTGDTIGAFLRREVSGPLGADFRFGTGPEHDPRIADFLGFEAPPPADFADAGEDDPGFLHRCVYLNPPGISGFGTVNTRAWRGAEMPSTNGHATARGVARVYEALANGGAVGGVRILGEDTLALAIEEVSAGDDVVLGRPSRFGLGFQLTQPERPLGPNPRAFGHFGAGGSLGFADLDARVAFAYVMNQPGPRWQNPRNRALVDAVYISL